MGRELLLYQCPFVETLKFSAGYSISSGFSVSPSSACKVASIVLGIMKQSLAALAVLACAGKVLAWGNLGHQTVGYVAMQVGELEAIMPRL